MLLRTYGGENGGHVEDSMSIGMAVIKDSDSKIGCVNKSDHGNNGGYNFARASGKSLSLFSVIQQCSSMPPRNII